MPTALDDLPELAEDAACGTAGPVRVPMGEQGEQVKPPYEVQENPNTWLDTTDLCFIDPIGMDMQASPETMSAALLGLLPSVLMAAVVFAIGLYLVKSARNP